MAFSHRGLRLAASAERSGQVVNAADPAQAASHRKAARRDMV
jgi:hypothetical protein